MFAFALRRHGVSTTLKVVAVIVVVAVVASGAYYGLGLTTHAPVTLTVYGSVDANDLQAAIKDFQGNYSYITVNYVEMNPPTAFSRITTELQANKSTADVAFITKSLMNPLKVAGDLLSYNSTQSSNYPASYHDPKGYFATAILLPVVFSYNTKQLNVSTLPKTLNDIASPTWKGKVIMLDPKLGSTATQYLLSLVPYAGGNASWTAWVQALATNVQPAVTSDTTVVANDVQQGMYSIGVVTYLHDVVRLKNQGAPISFFLPQGVPLLTAPSTIAIVKNTKHLTEAQLFEDFMLSKATQTVIGNSAVRFPAYPGVTAKNTIESVAPGASVVFFPTAQVSAAAKVWAAKFKAMGY
jgi:iron(III) transport system substrate-binding protein